MTYKHAPTIYSGRPMYRPRAWILLHVNLLFKFQIIEYALSISKSCNNIFNICSDFNADVYIFINNLCIIQQESPWFCVVR